MSTTCKYLFLALKGISILIAYIVGQAARKKGALILSQLWKKKSCSGGRALFSSTVKRV